MACLLTGNRYMLVAFVQFDNGAIAGRRNTSAMSSDGVHRTWPYGTKADLRLKTGMVFIETADQALTDIRPLSAIDRGKHSEVLAPSIERVCENRDPKL